MSWVPQRAIGADIVPAEQSVAVGATVLLVLHRGPAWMVARNRVVAVVDEPTRFAYAYGTLPGHPERGEEAFVLELSDDDAVRLSIRLAAGPSTRVGLALTPLVRWLSHAALRRYLLAVADHVAATTTAVAP